jgi:hypothetical protein
MSAWKVEYLLKNQQMIRDNLVEDCGNFLQEPLISYNFENEVYGDLLIIERTIEELRAKGKISDIEYLIIDLIKNSTMPKEMERITGIEKQTIYKIFSNSCGKIAFILGNNFTNEGMIESICQERDLSEEQVQMLRNYVNRNTVDRYI